MHYGHVKNKYCGHKVDSWASGQCLRGGKMEGKETSPVTVRVSHVIRVSLWLHLLRPNYRPGYKVSRRGVSSQTICIEESGDNTSTATHRVSIR